MKKPRLILCDIDGTLIVRHQPMSEKAKQMIRRLREKGVYFGIASGRPLYQIRDTYKSWGFEDFDCLIGFNGSSLWDGISKQEEDHYIMKKEWIKETIDLMSRFDTNPSIYLHNQVVFLNNDATSRHYASDARLAKGIEEFYSEDNAKIMFRLDEKLMPEVEQWIAEHPSPYYAGFKTQTTLIEFCDKRVNKAFAMKIFCDAHHIDPSEVMAFGDTTNDNEMLEYAGWGVCLRNGSEDTKAIADEITDKPCEEDGWADYIEKRVLPLLDDK